VGEQRSSRDGRDPELRQLERRFMWRNIFLGRLALIVAAAVLVIALLFRVL
jgi:hypothetical protein